MKKVLIAYIPVLHQGYINLFSQFNDGSTDLYVAGKSFFIDKRPFQKDLRAIEPDLISTAIKSLDTFRSVQVIEKGDALDFSQYFEINMPKDEFSEELINIFNLNVVKLIPYFLRWDSDNAKAHMDVNYDKEVVLDKYRQDILNQIVTDSEKSTDLYRQVGGAVFKEGGFCMMGYNHAVPSSHTPFYEGDPRGQFNKGVNVELSLFIHAEASLISEAARKGVSLDGAEMIVTDFPCPPCAKLIANSGIKKLYYLKGYAMLDGERILKDGDVEIIKIKS